MPPGELVTVPEPPPYRLTWSVNFVFAAEGVAAPTASVAAAAIASSRPSAPRRGILESAAVSPTASPWLLNDPKPGTDPLSSHQDGLRGRPRPAAQLYLSQAFRNGRGSNARPPVYHTGA